MKRAVKSFPHAKPMVLPISGLALAVVLSGLGEGALAANSHPAKKAVKPASTTAAKSKAASLLSAPMSATLDNLPAKRADESIAVAPPIENGKTRAHKLLKEGARQHRLGEYAEAERLFREAVANDPRNADGFFNLGALAEGRGDLIDALTQYRSGLSIKANDPALKEAVQSIETRLAAGERTPAQVENQRHGSFKYPPTMFSNPNPTVGFSEPQVLTVQPFEAPQLTTSTDSPPILPVSNDGPFQLNSTQNAALGPRGSYGSLNGNLGTNSSQPPTLSVGQRNMGARRIGGGAMSAILNIGMRSALSGTGLHCPACRLLRF